MVERFLEDFTVGRSFGSGRLKIDAEVIKRFVTPPNSIPSLFTSMVLAFFSAPKLTI